MCNCLVFEILLVLCDQFCFKCMINENDLREQNYNYEMIFSNIQVCFTNSHNVQKVGMTITFLEPHTM